uniref:DUF7597 domain-containing protein n=1 Tax=Oryza punctata TaxID=4537 RepID=A0A0E0JSF5_ORYPU
MGVQIRGKNLPVGNKRRKISGYRHLDHFCLAHKVKKFWRKKPTQTPAESSKELIFFGNPSTPFFSPYSLWANNASFFRHNRETPILLLHDGEFLPQGADIEVPWGGRTPRADFTFHGTIIKTHEDFAAVVVEPQPQPHQVGQLIQEVANFIQHHHNIHVNANDRVLGRVLVKTRYKSANEVPIKIVMGDPTDYGGQGQTWTFHVYVLQGEQADVLPGDEDLLPIWQMLQPPQPQEQGNQNQDNWEEENAFENQNNAEQQGENQMILDQNPGEQPHDSFTTHGDNPSAVKQRKMIKAGKYVARSLFLSAIEDTNYHAAVPNSPKARKKRPQVPISSENLTRSPRFSSMQS